MEQRVNASGAALESRVHPERARSRTRLLDTPTLRAEDLRTPGHRHRLPESYCSSFHVCFPYRGLFVWHVGRDDVVADPNQVLFVTPDEAFHISQPAQIDYGELIITPRLDVLTELAAVDESRLAAHPLFRRRHFRATSDAQRAAASFLRAASRTHDEALRSEETLLDLLRLALTPTPPLPRPSATTRRLIARAKEYLEAHLADAIQLADVAEAAGASPTYLTDTFRRTEGVPLHRYLVQLRLARSLVELPHANDLTTLALDLGFSSHSHFSAAFRREFRCTPSQFRASTRRI